MKIPFALANDGGGKLAREYGINGYPSAYLINARGKVTWAGHPATLNESHIKEALKGATPGPPATLPKKVAEADKAIAKGELAKADKILRDALAAQTLLPEEKTPVEEALKAIEEGGSSALAGARERLAAGEVYLALLEFQEIQTDYGTLAPGVAAAEEAAAILGDASLAGEIEGGKKNVEAKGLLEKGQYKKAHAAYAAVAEGFPGTKAGAAAGEEARRIKDEGLYHFNPKCRSCKEIGRACSKCDRG